jgi:hypothetical protein
LSNFYKIILGCSPASTPLNGTPPGSLEAAVPGFYKKKEDEEEPVFFPGSSKKKSSKKGGGRTAGDHRRLSLRKSLSHSPEIFGQFARLSLAPPANLAELDSVLEQLRARHKLYQRLAEQELNSRLGGAQRAATHLDIPAIVVEATANNISLEEPPPGELRPVLLFGEAAPSSTTESGKVVHQSASTSFSLSALSSSLETESACCDWPQLSYSRSGGSVPPSSSPVLTLTASVASSLNLLSLSSEVVRPSSLLSTPPLIPTNEESAVSQSLVQSAMSPVLPLEDAPTGSPAVEADSSSLLHASPSVDGPLSHAVVLNGPLITQDDAGDTVEVLPCPSLVLSSPENEDSSCVVVDGAADSCCLDTVSDCTLDTHPSVAASGSPTVEDAAAGPLSSSPRYRPSLSLDLGGKTSSLIGDNGETSPLMGGNGETSPLMADNGETSRIIGGNGETSPLMSDNGKTSPLMGDNGETSPLMDGNGETSPLIGGNGETSPLMDGNGETSPLMGNNGETSPLMGGNGETSPLMGGNGEPAKEILQESASPPCSDPALTQ